MAKPFFYACAGVFLLVAALHLGASAVTAQGTLMQAANLESSGSGQFYTCMIGRTMYAGSGYPWDVIPLPTPVPGSDPVVATSGMFEGPTALLQNGDVYVWNGPWNTGAGTWVLRGNILGVPANARRVSWGALKELSR